MAAIPMSGNNHVPTCYLGKIGGITGRGCNVAFSNVFNIIAVSDLLRILPFALVTMALSTGSYSLALSNVVHCTLAVLEGQMHNGWANYALYYWRLNERFSIHSS